MKALLEQLVEQGAIKLFPAPTNVLHAKVGETIRLHGKTSRTRAHSALFDEDERSKLNIVNTNIHTHPRRGPYTLVFKGHPSQIEYRDQDHIKRVSSGGEIKFVVLRNDSQTKKFQQHIAFYDPS